MTQEHWDAVVIGSGFGGSTVALKLAAAGAQVLVLERGRWADRDKSAWDSHAIQIERKYKSRTPYEVDERWGREVTYPDDTVGGKSVFYGAASFRLRAEDFHIQSRFNPADLDSVPPMDWPIDYGDLEPFYGEAEREIGVAGLAGADPNEPTRSTDYPAVPPKYGSSARRIANAAIKLGLKPFPMPLAINFEETQDRPKCKMCMTCDLFPCKVCAKNDLSVTLLPKAQRSGAVVRDQTVVKRLVTSGGRVREVECLDVLSGREFSVTCELCVVSCGPIASAALLLSSGLDRVEPNGRLLGRYLMRHCSGIVIGIFPFKTNPERQFHKQFAITDFYFGHPKRGPDGPWGMIQALQTPPPEFVREMAPYPQPIGTIGSKTLPYHAYLLCIAEDLPHIENRVEVDRQRLDPYGSPIAQVYHKYCRRDLLARRALYREATRILRKAKSIVRVRLPIHTYSHALGTARFGTDPEQAVLDPWCRFFGVPNLFVVDGSFMPTSAGVNPSLTIAANGLRVGQHLADNWDEAVSKSTS
jgi:choline dehydrogenase-like flavoprotein